MPDVVHFQLVADDFLSMFEGKEVTYCVTTIIDDEEDDAVVRHVFVVTNDGQDVVDLALIMGVYSPSKLDELRERAISEREAQSARGHP